MSAVEVSSLVVRYGSITAVDGISFTADAGHVHTLLGPNGAGKTTTVETLEGYRRPDAGHVRVLGLDPRADHARVVHHIGVMLQRGGMYPGMNGRDALRLTASYYRDPLDPDDLLARVGLDRVAATPFRRLSGGEQQRLGLALAIIGRPDVVFLDEPTAGIDPQARLAVRDIIAGLARDGACVLLTTHDLDEAERVADVVTIIDHGRVVASGSPRELATSGGNTDIRFRAEPSIDIGALGAAMHCIATEERPGEYHVAVPSTPSTIAMVTAWLASHDITIAELRAGRESLEDVFLRLTTEDTP